MSDTNTIEQTESAVSDETTHRNSVEKRREQRQAKRVARKEQRAQRKREHEERRAGSGEQKSRSLSKTCLLKKCGKKRPKKPCDCSGPVLDGDLLLETQLDVENFRQQAYAIVTGNVTVDSDPNNPIRNLLGLASLCEVKGDLFIETNDQLLTLDGLQNLQRVGKDFSIADNALLRSVDKLENLRTVGEDFVIVENNSLTEIGGLNCLEYVGKDIAIEDNENLVKITGFNNKNGLQIDDELLLRNNNSLVLIDGFNGVTSVVFCITIDGNMLLERIFGFKQLRNVLNFEIFIASNASLKEIDAFSVVEIVENICISENPALYSITGFQKLRCVRDITLRENQVLEKIDAFQQLTTVTDLVISETNLSDLDAFAALQFVKDDVELDNNPALHNIDGLINLRYVDSNVVIEDNNALKSLAGLSRLRESNQVGNQVQVENNSVLSDYCGLQSLAEADPTGSPPFTIAGNAVNLTKEQIADLEPCDARDFFERTLNRWLAEKTIDSIVACSLACSMTKANVRKWQCANKLTLVQAVLLLGALDACLFANDDALPPRGPPLDLPATCCNTSKRSQQFALVTGLCNSRAHRHTCTCRK